MNNIDETNLYEFVINLNSNPIKTITKKINFKPNEQDLEKCLTLIFGEKAEKFKDFSFFNVNNDKKLISFEINDFLDVITDICLTQEKEDTLCIPFISRDNILNENSILLIKITYNLN